jgi:hypothetical protein
MCVIIANTMEQCSLFLPLLRGAGPMALMLWLMMMTISSQLAVATESLCNS